MSTRSVCHLPGMKRKPHANAMSPQDHERIRINAPRFSAHELAKLMGRNSTTLRRWASANGVVFKRKAYTHQLHEREDQTERMLELSERIGPARVRLEKKIQAA